MKNPIKKLFQVTFDPTRRSWKDFDHKVDFTASTGWLIPFDVQEVLPGDHWECDPMIYVQTNPLQTPLLSSFTCTVDAFFIPTRLYVQALDQNNMSLAFDADTPFPYINLPGNRFTDGWPLETNTEETALANRSTSLISFLGMCPPTDFERFAAATASDSIRLNAVPLVGYYDIFRNVYANIHNTSGVPYRCGIGRHSSNMGQLVDYFLPLKYFDNFINLVTLKSLNISNTGDIRPQAVNAGVCWREAGGSGSIYVPWFANGRTRSDASSRDVTHLGLLRRTYADDYFTAYFKNSYVSAAEETAVVNVKNNKFSVYQLRFQNRIARFVDRNLLSNFRYGGYLNVHFGVSASKNICKPIFLGRKRCVITFNEVISSTEGAAESVGDNKSLGSRASLGSGFTDHDKRNMFELDSSEYGYIMHIFSIRPEVSYYQGIPKMYMKTQLSHLYVPEFDGYGYQDLSALELIATKPYFENTAGTTWPAQNLGIAQHPAYIEYMTTVDSVKGLFTDDTYYKNWFLTRRFDELPYYGVDPVSTIASTYIYPEAYDYIFPVQKELDNFQVHVKFRMRVKRPMSAQILPSL